MARSSLVSRSGAPSSLGRETVNTLCIMDPPVSKPVEESGRRLASSEENGAEN
jgi:hypothetical protein